MAEENTFESGKDKQKNEIFDKYLLNDFTIKTSTNKTRWDKTDNFGPQNILYSPDNFRILQQVSSFWGKNQTGLGLDIQELLDILLEGS